MLLYFNGDSFTAGSELQDSILPGFPGLVKWDDVPKVSRKWRTDIVNDMANMTLSESEYHAAGRSRAWPQKLCDLLGAECVNGAFGGSSMLGILHRTSIDLLNLQASGKTPDRVLIQLTGMNRSGIYKLERFHNLSSEEFIVRDFIAGFTGFTPDAKLIGNYAEAWLRAEDDKDLAHRWFHQMFLLKHLVISLTGKPPVFLDSCFLPKMDSRVWASHPSTHKIVSDLGFLKNFPSDLYIQMDPELRMQSYVDQRTDLFCPLGHYSEIIHDRFAKALKDKLFSQ